MQVTYNPLSQFLTIKSPTETETLLINTLEIERVKPRKHGCFISMKSGRHVTVSSPASVEPRGLHKMIIRALMSDSLIVVHEKDVAKD